MKRCIILAGGPLSDCAGVKLRAQPGDFVVACDAGYLAAAHFGLTPDLVVGDFDSFHGRLAPGVPVFTAPAHKDDTDTILGIRKGLERGCEEFILLGAFGGRLDHTIANLQTLCWLCEQGARGRILADRNCAWAVKDGALKLPRMEGWHLSVFASGAPCTGVNLEGVAYPLENATLTASFPLGVSNEFTAEYATVTAGHGTLLVVASEE